MHPPEEEESLESPRKTAKADAAGAELSPLTSSPLPPVLTEAPRYILLARWRTTPHTPHLTRSHLTRPHVRTPGLLNTDTG